jgi:hypothetical protein
MNMSARREVAMPQSSTTRTPADQAFLETATRDGVDIELRGPRHTVIVMLVPAVVIGLGLVILLDRMRSRNTEGVALLRAGIGICLISGFTYGVASYVFTVSNIDQRPDERPKFEAGPWLALCGLCALAGLALCIKGVTVWHRHRPAAEVEERW